MVPKISTVPVPSLTDQHLPVLHNKLASYRKRSKGTNVMCQEKERSEIESTAVDKVLYNSMELVN